MKKWLLVLAVFAVVGVSFSVWSDDKPKAAEVKDDIEAHVKKQPELVIKDSRALDPKAETLRLPEEGAIPSCIAFSVSGSSHTSQGQDALLKYNTTITNENAPWTEATFLAPRDGLYSFTISFVTSTNVGEQDGDVEVHIVRSDKSLGYALKGEQAPAAFPVGVSRIGATWTVVAKLKRGEHIQTFVRSEGGYMRRLHKFDFTGYYICK